MTRSKTSDLEKLLRGQAVSKEAFLALLTDPDAKADLEQIAGLRDLVGTPLDEDAMPPPPPVDWDDLAAYSDGSLADAGKCVLIEQYLAEHAPELLRARRDDTTIDFRGAFETQYNVGGNDDTVVPPPRRRPKDDHAGS